ncbi:protein FAM110C [Canis lupus familiaris]|uniref:protein FAM110C n=1 Tax=Canis lupus familiaris TaxID=9615 RepID=UPI0018F41962|nr:protein FAM110C [Canis lupus familiaris]
MRALPGLDAPQRQRPPAQQPEGPRGRDAAVPARRSAAERLAADRAKYLRGPRGAGPAPEGSSAGPSAGAAGAPGPPAPAPAPAPAPGAVARRTVARRPLRPDSLVIYRQKCDFVRGQGADGPRAGLVRKLFPGPGRDRAAACPGTARGDDEAPAAPPAAPGTPRGAPAAPPAPPAPPTPPASCAAPRTPASSAPPGPQPRGSRRGGLRRSQSDLSSRYSASLAEFDTFFQFCGLDPEVLDALGRENFSAGSDRVTPQVRSVSVATSDSGFSRRSGGQEGLQEEELTEQVPSTTSVVERNARIIKWLYTCKRAKETPGQGLQGPA